MKEIVKTVANYYGIPDMLLYGSSRKSNICHPRHISVYIMKVFLKKKNIEIGRFYNRSHATILHSYNSIKQEIEVSKKLRTEIDVIINSLIKPEYDKKYCLPIAFKFHKI